MAWWLVLLGVLSYLVGCFNFARLISKKMLKDDITKHGSGNPGTTNMYRVFGLKIGFINLFLDILKGLIPTLVGFLVFGYQGAFLAGTCAVFGHIYPVFYKFKGGKGIATTLGVFAVICPIWLIIVLVVMGLIIFLCKYMAPVSLSAIAFLVCLQASRFAGDVLICTCCFLIFVLTWFAHRQNIIRMMSGTENKLSFKRKKN